MTEDIINSIRISKSTLLANLLSKNFTSQQIVEYALKIEERKGKKILISENDAKIEMEKALKLGMQMISFLNPLYPEDLKNIINPPTILYAKGNVQLLEKPKFAIIGARFSTFESGVLAQDFAEKLSGFGFCIVSGFAYGIDTFACKGAIKYGTIQVLGSGIDIIYPKPNAKLYEEVLENNGLFLSELPPNSPARPDNFPLRNRIISGISKGVLLVQASERNGSSGSLITARIALEHEKDLFAIPGHPLDLKFSGGNDLIKNGNAIFTTCPQDIIDLIGYHLTKKERNFCFKPKNLLPFPSSKPEAVEEIEAPKDLKDEIKLMLSTNPISIDQIQEMLNIDIQKIQIALIEMELCNEVQKHYSGKFSISLL